MRRSFVSTWRSVTLSIHAIPDYIPSYWRSVAFSINKAFDCVPFSIHNEPDCVPLKGRDILHTRDTHVCLIEITWHSLYISHLCPTEGAWQIPYTRNTFLFHYCDILHALGLYHLEALVDHKCFKVVYHLPGLVVTRCCLYHLPGLVVTICGLYHLPGLVVTRYGLYHVPGLIVTSCGIYHLLVLVVTRCGLYHLPGLVVTRCGL